MTKKLKLFAMNSSQDYGREVAEYLGVPLCKHEEYYFDDKEVYCASLENVRERDVFVIHSLYSDRMESVNDKLMKLLIFLGSLHDASAKRVTVVLPYVGGRQDRKTASRAPITTKYVARLFKSLWTKRLLTLDIHNPVAIQNTYPIPVDLLEAKNLFALYVRDLVHKKYPDCSDLVVLSPDAGGLTRARAFRRVLNDLLSVRVSIACMDKEHVGDRIKGYNIIADEPIRGKHVVIYDDMISSGKTNLECVEACQRNGAKMVMATCASHGLFVGKANQYLDNPFLRHIAVTDTVSPFRLENQSVKNKLSVIKTTKLFAEAIRRIHVGESISDLIASNNL